MLFAIRTAAAVVLVASACAARGDALALAEAEALALAGDPSVLTIEAHRTALEERAAAAGELPDPMLKVGMMSLPTDSFDLGQEAMTQAQVGLSQRFPRGDTRALRSEQLRERAAGLDDAGRDQRLRITQAVRLEYLETVKQRRLAAINREAQQVFGELLDITGEYYATGRVQQQDVLRAAVELARIEDRGQRIAEAEDQARARLATWIGDAAYRDVPDGWPSLDEPAESADIERALLSHPRLVALQREIAAAETGVDIAREATRPEISLDLTYGARSGRDPNGMPRSDLVSLMLVMDLPLFRERRQDRLTAASVAESSAAVHARDDSYRRMRSDAALYAATLHRQRARLDLFRDSLLPDAAFNADAAFEAYQSAVTDLTTLMRARITEYELQLEQAGLRAEELKTRARLLYLQGEAK